MPETAPRAAMTATGVRRSLKHSQPAKMAAANPVSILENQPFPIQAPLERKLEQRSFFGRAKRNVTSWGNGSNDW